MRLTAIKLAGFKSFVDAVTLPLPSNLVAIVGPNGSGKSNLIDAVRWALGESSSKTLRGTDADDMIFSGAGGRKQSGRASVELLFDNIDRTLQGPFGVYSEISLRREVVRGEGSQYFLNGQKCLKRDAVNLFLGTGLGARSQYAILEQGSIARVVDAKPEDMRSWLEEVAGISRYRERRRECELRIRDTRENLVRLNDLQQEVEHRLRTLERQANAANRYMALREKERRLKAEILLLRRRSHDSQLDLKEKFLNDCQIQLAEARESMARAEDHHVRCVEAQRNATEQLGFLQGELYQAEAALSSQQQALAHSKELSDLQERELRQIESQIEDSLVEETRLLESEASLAVAEKKAALRVDEAMAQELMNCQEAEAAEALLSSVQTEWDSFGHQIHEPLVQAEGERAKLNAVQSAIERIDVRIRQLESERGQLDPAPLRTLLQDVIKELGFLDREQGSIRRVLKNIENELQTLRGQYRSIEIALHEWRNSLENVRGRRASLETLQQAALRQDNQSVSEWLEEYGWADQAQLATLIHVMPGWENAVEHALGGLLHAPLLASWSVLKLPEKGPSDGLILASGHITEDRTPRGSLAEVVTGPRIIREWLQSVYRLDDRDELENRLRALKPGESIITTDAVWYGRGWVRYPPMDPESSGVLVRTQVLKELAEQDEHLDGKVHGAECDLTQLNDRIEVLENAKREALARYDRVRSEHSRQQGERQKQQVRIEQLEERIKHLDLDSEALQEERKRHLSERLRTEEILVELECVSERLRIEHGDLQRRVAAAREKVQLARNAFLVASQERSQAQIHLAANESAVGSVRTALGELQQRLKKLKDEHGQRTLDLKQLQMPSNLRQEEVMEARRLVESERAKLLQARENLTAVEVDVAKSRRVFQDKVTERDRIVEQLQQARLEVEAIRGRKEALAPQLAETGQDIEALGAALDVDAIPEVWEKKLEDVSREIARLGPINLAAVSELDECQQRASYLTGQRLDLDQSLEALEDVMRKLDKETRDLFQGTFNRVNSLFGERWLKLFSGGEAWLEMTGENWMAAGIRVMARPPGKRNSVIQSLSGGEKALAALALLFALFDLNPAPFCLLDEVEAPLDDANVYRFVELIRDMSKEVQFIVVTHNKITMEAADHLHGVTMQESGVSRLVSVDMHQAGGFVDSSPETAEA